MTNRLALIASLVAVPTLALAQPKNDTGGMDTLIIVLAVVGVAAVVYYLSTRKKS